MRSEWDIRRFDHLVDLLLRAGGKERLMAFLEGYFDESGTHGSAASHVVVAGFVADAPDWKKFSMNWDRALKDHGVPFFKAQWFAKRKEFFRSEDWDEPRRTGFMSRLLSVIESTQPVPVAAVIPINDFDEIIPRRMRAKTGTAYTICGQLCMIHAGEWAKANGHTEPIAYVFDSGHPNRGDFEVAHRQDDEGRKNFLMGSLTFGDERDIPPLQAADLLAYEVFQVHSGKRKRHPIKEILIKLDMQDVKWGRAHLIDHRNRNFPTDLFKGTAG